MNVENIFQEKALCVWFDGKEFKRDVFNISTLMINSNRKGGIFMG